MGQKGVHYFPGHMQKALRALEGYVKVIDLVVEIVDARAPLSSRNPLLDELAGDKARLVLLSKEDRDLYNQYLQLKAEKKFDESDKLRQQLAERGII